MVINTKTSNNKKIELKMRQKIFAQNVSAKNSCRFHSFKTYFLAYQNENPEPLPLDRHFQQETNSK